MTLETLQKEMIVALKAGDKLRKTTISTFIAQIKRVAIDKGVRDNITEDIVDAELQKIKKQIQDSIDTCPNHRPDLREQYSNQMAIVNEFVPTVITDEAQIKDIILSCGIEVSKINQGAIMKAVKTNYAGKIDMKVVNKVFREMV